LQPRLQWRRGAWLGVDVGRVRIGTAISDPDGILATPLMTVRRDAGPSGTGVTGSGQTDQTTAKLPEHIQVLQRIIAEHDIVGVVVGLPVTLAGTQGPAALEAREFAGVLAGAIASIPVVLADERMTTAVAGRRLAERGVRGARRRAVVDQAAAVEILQGWLDAQRRLRC
jgi:putative Holliday junction resolvase